MPCTSIIPSVISQMYAMGVRHIVVSSGSRSFPIVSAVVRSGLFSITTILDERSAAFFAIGISRTTGGEPVALICTSGSAVLNYGPAVAEAFYSHLPLLVISADRPADRLNQNEPQTIDQTGVLSNITCVSESFKADYDDIHALEAAQKRLADIFGTLLPTCSQPVHINIHIPEPLCVPGTSPQTVLYSPTVKSVFSSEAIGVEELAEDYARLNRVMIFVGPGYFRKSLYDILCQLNNLPNTVILTEPSSGYPTFISGFDTLKKGLTKEICPQLLISIGGAPTSRAFKQYIKENNVPNWHIAHSAADIDGFRTLRRMIKSEPSHFLSELYRCLQCKDIVSDYSKRMRCLSRHIHERVKSYDFDWSDIGALQKILPYLANVNLQCSNGMLIRYYDMLNIMPDFMPKSFGCNRGVSGIDGSTSTALGSASVSSVPTVLLTGDLSAQYDIGALFATELPVGFRMIVFCNNGGDIFRIIEATRTLPEREKYLSMSGLMPEQWEYIAKAAKMEYNSARNYNELASCLNGMFANDAPSLLTINTSGIDNLKILNNFTKTI